jgi:hypothetical protein
VQAHQQSAAAPPRSLTPRRSSQLGNSLQCVILRRDSSLLVSEGELDLQSTTWPLPSQAARTWTVVLDQEAVLERKRSATRRALPVDERVRGHGQVPDPRGVVVAGGDDARAVWVEAAAVTLSRCSRGSAEHDARASVAVGAARSQAPVRGGPDVHRAAAASPLRLGGWTAYRKLPSRCSWDPLPGDPARARPRGRHGRGPAPGRLRARRRPRRPRCAPTTAPRWKP